MTQTTSPSALDAIFAKQQVIVGSQIVEYATLAALRAVQTAPTDGAYVNIVTPPSQYRYSSTSGNGFADDGRTIIRLTANPTGNGVFYNTASSAVAVTMAAFRAMVANKQDHVHVLSYSALGDGGGGIFYRDDSDGSSADNDHTIVVIGVVRWKNNVQAKAPRTSRPTLKITGDNGPLLSGSYAEIPSDGEVEIPSNSDYQPTSTALILNAARVKIFGHGRDRSKLRVTGTIPTYGFFQGSALPETIEIRDLTIDGAGLVGYMCNAYGFQVRDVLIENCDIENTTGLWSQEHAGRVRVKNCRFDDHGKPRSKGVWFTGPHGDTEISDCEFRWLNIAAHWDPSSIGFTPTAPVQSRHLFTRNKVLCGWYHCPTLLRGDGSAMAGSCTTSSGPTITDASHALSTCPNNTHVRLLPTRVSGTGTLSGAGNMTLLHDAGTDFISSGVLEGEIILINGFRALVENVMQHYLVLTVPYDVTTGDNQIGFAAAFVLGSVAYTVYAVVVMGATTGADTHTITGSWGFYDLSGLQLTAGAGLLAGSVPYEVVPPQSYGVRAERGVSDITISDSYFSRTMGDSINLFGGTVRSHVHGNRIHWPSDTGFSTEGSLDNAHIHDNLAYRAGFQGWLITGLDCNMHDNQAIGCAWSYHGPLRAAVATNLQDSTAHHNYVDSLGLPQSQLASWIIWGSTNAIYQTNTVKGCEGVAEMIVTGGDGGVTGCTIEHHSTAVNPITTVNPGYPGLDSIVVNGVGQLIRLYASGAPGASAVSAAPGSTYIDTASGKNYIKTAGTDATGWKEITGLT